MMQLSPSLLQDLVSRVLEFYCFPVLLTKFRFPPRKRVSRDSEVAP